MASPNRRNRQFLRPPTADEVRELAAAEHMRLDAAEAEEMATIVRGTLEVVARLDELPQPRVELRHKTRDPGYVPALDEDPYNAFARRCHVGGADDGPLSGLTFGVKDNIAVAGVPLTNASPTLTFTPTQDAVVVERLLDAGADLVGKLNMDDFASGATGETSWFGPARNPTDPSYSAGGSSGGSGSAVASGAVDFSLGVDQGGSARIPASFCGVVSIKGTHSLIPSHGSTHLDHTLDYICPTAIDVDRAARVLEVVAGPDWRDPNHGRIVTRQDRYAVDAADPQALRLGIVRQGLSGTVCEDAVLSAFHSTVERLRENGATIVELDVPFWEYSWVIQAPMLIHLAGSMIKADGYGYGHFGLIDIDRFEHAALVRRAQADQFPPLVKEWLISERYLADRYQRSTYAKAQNARVVLRSQIESALEGVDALIMPGTPGTAPKLELEDDAEIVLQVPAYNYNTCPLNLSGHPAIVQPNGTAANGLPTSFQVVGKYWDEPRLVGIARLVEELSRPAGLLEGEVHNAV